MPRRSFLRRAPPVSMPPPELEQLVESHRSALHTYVSFRLDRELRRREPVSDIVQSALREVLANPGRFTSQGPEALRAFLIRAVEHKIANKRRYWDTQKRSGRNHDPIDDPGDIAASDSRAETPSQVVEQREALEHLAAALDELSEEDRRILTMRRFAGLSAEAIGAELGLSPSTVRYHLGRIMALLSHRLAEHGQG
jgi:RNA polymerase sigma factor (sigma-70 family)